MRWTEDQIKYLREFYPIMPTSEVSQHLNRHILAVRTKACELGISKTKEFRSMMSKRPNKSHFKKGHTTWNKGLKLGSEWGGKETRFKKGQEPHNKLTPEIKEVTKLIRKIKRYAKKQN